MSAAADPTTALADRLRREVGARIREFPVEVEVVDGRASVVLRGAAGSVTALRGARERIQPLLKRAVRDLYGGRARFDTRASDRGADLVVTVEIDAA